MEDYSRNKLKNIELFGLPGVGKSYLLDKLSPKYKKDARKVEKSFNFVKVINIFFGLRKIGIFLFIEMFFYAKFKKESTKLLFVFLERLGRSISNENCIFDEGILQALWGYFYRIDYEKSFMRKVLSKKIFLNKIIYVSISKKMHEQFLTKRGNNGFLFRKEVNYIKARKTLFDIICLVRKNDLYYYRNKKSIDFNKNPVCFEL